MGKLGVVIGFIQDPSETVTGKINTCLPRKAVLPIVGQAECNRPIYSFELCLGVVGADNIVCAVRKIIVINFVIIHIQNNIN